jgi:replicative DNA helicase
VTDRHSTRTVSVHDALGELDRQLRDRAAADVRTVPSGFDVLDETLGGGLHVGELLLVGGPPGVGKTIVALQWARNVARAGHRAVFVCYEHEPTTLLTRLLALEAGEAGGDRSIARTLTSALSDADAGGRGLDEVLGSLPLGGEVRKRVDEYAENLILVRGSGSHTTLEALADVLAPHLEPHRRTILFVDYLQKIPMHPEPALEAEKVTRTVEGLKDLALDAHVPVVLLSAVDAAGMQSSRLRMHHLRGSSAIAFESDVVVMMNHKDQAVSKVHLSYDSVRARTFREWVVMSIEKNRGGPNLIDLEFRKDFAHFRFDPEGGIVGEQLVNERFDEAGL